MRKKKRFAWNGKTERSLAELVSEDGVLHTGEICGIVRRLCALLESPEGSVGRLVLCPASVMVDEYGDVRLAEREFSPAEIGAYLPPEQNRAELISQSEKVYALGMLMLFMATGEEKKADAEISLERSRLLPVIRRATAFDPMDRYEGVSALGDALKRETRAGRKAAPFLLYLLYAAAVAALVFFAWRTGGADGAKAGDTAGYGPGYAAGYGRGAYAAPGLTVEPASANESCGSLSGNFSSGEGPTAAFSDTDVFFLRDGDIVRMDAITGRTEILKKGSGAYSLQYYQGSLYCCTPESVLRIDPETKKEEVVCDSLGGRLYIFDGDFYLYDSAGTRYLYRISKTGRTLTQLSGARDYRCLNVADGKLYYIDPNQGNGICCSGTDGNNAKPVSSSSYESFCVYDGKIYAASDHGLIRMDLNGGNPETLSALPAFLPNAADNGTFFISGSGRTLEWISPDGGTRYTVVPSRTESFQLAGQWLLFRNEDDGGRLWKVRVSGADGSRVS